jgi:hypothetical protein
MAEAQDQHPTVAQLQTLFRHSVEGEPFHLLPGFPGGARPDVHILGFAASCHCGVSCLLQVEVGKSKTLQDVTAALPSLVEHLRARSRMFFTMPCSVHAQMRKGPGGRTLAPAAPKKQGQPPSPRRDGVGE